MATQITILFLSQGIIGGATVSITPIQTHTLTGTSLTMTRLTIQTHPTIVLEYKLK
jgi:hypothetical protein